jgi:hypothetical protein
VIDLREQHDGNEFDLMCVNTESVSNDIDESEVQCQRHSEQRI